MCAIEAFVLTLLTKCPSELCRQGFHLARRRYRRGTNSSHHGSDMCLQERELTPICSNEVLPSQTHEIPNHHHSLSYNNNSRGSPTTPPICNQKPYIPGEFSVLISFSVYRYQFRIQSYKFSKDLI